MEAEHSTTQSVPPSPVPPLPPPPPPLPIAHKQSSSSPLDLPCVSVFDHDGNAASNVDRIPSPVGMRDQVVERIRLRPLYWKKIQSVDPSPRADTVWRVINDMENINDCTDYKPLKTLFPARNMKNNRSSFYSTSTTIVRLLDHRRSQAIAILLRNLPADGMTELTDVDNCGIEPNILVSLAELVRKIINSTPHFDCLSYEMLYL